MKQTQFKTKEGYLIKEGFNNGFYINRHHFTKTEIKKMLIEREANEKASSTSSLMFDVTNPNINKRLRK